eukprot:CFRG1183T1
MRISSDRQDVLSITKRLLHNPTSPSFTKASHCGSKERWSTTASSVSSYKAVPWTSHREEADVHVQNDRRVLPECRWNGCNEKFDSKEALGYHMNNAHLGMKAYSDSNGNRQDIPSKRKHSQQPSPPKQYQRHTRNVNYTYSEPRHQKTFSPCTSPTSCPKLYETSDTYWEQNVNRSRKASTPIPIHHDFGDSSAPHQTHLHAYSMHEHSSHSHYRIQKQSSPSPRPSSLPLSYYGSSLTAESVDTCKSEEYYAHESRDYQNNYSDEQTRTLYEDTMDAGDSNTGEASNDGDAVFNALELLCSAAAIHGRVSMSE